MRRTFLQTALAALAVTGTALAGSFTSSFTSPTPSGFILNGNSATRPDGSTFEPVIQDGHLILTYGENSQQGTIVLDDLDAGAAVESFVARFKLQIGPGSGNPADGLAFSFGPEVDSSANFGEEGIGTGIIVSFDIYDNGGGEAPAIDVKYNGVVLASAKFAKADLVTGAFEDVEIQLTRSGVISVSHKGKKVHDNIFIPGFAPITGLFAIGARTGGENANHWLDDVSVTTVKATPVAPTITTQPVSKAVTEGQPVTFTAGFDGSAPFTLQWLSNNVAIPDATNTSYTIDRVALAANAAKYKLAVSNAVAGVTSAEAVLTVTPLSKPLTLLYATGTRTFTGVRVWFSSPLDPVTAGTAANYKLSGGVTVTSATLAGAVGSASDSMVDLVTSAQTPGQAYTLTVSGVKDQTSVGNTVTNGSTAQFSAWTLVQGALLFEHWSGLSGVGDADIDKALADPRVVANDPTTIGLATRFDTRTVFPDDSHENYLARLSGWITPTETADYYFFLRADDGARLYLSTNETLPNPAVDTPIANEPGCCGVFFEPDSGDPATTPAPISLVAGKRYGVMALLKEGGGGDYLMVAWRKSTDTTPATELPYLPGQFLSTYVDPNVDLAITKQPVDQPGVVASAGIEIFARDFNANDGGFTVTNTEPPPPGPWIYDAAKGLWVADGSEDGCTGPYNSQLNSPPYKLTQDGAVSISFSHRYSFEGGLYDAGQVRISVNGGPFTLVPAGNFTANGYAEGAILGTGLAKGLRAFNDDSPGFVDGKFITSKALLGTFRKDDTLVVQFLGAWDECSAGRHPSWEIDSLNLVLLPMIIKDFVASNGGFTVENTTPPPAGPWTYDSTNGVWFANGSDDGCTGPYNSKLNSTPFVAPESDEVTLTFTHRYSFESGFYDGGQVRLSVNGGPFTTVAADRFTANGYADSPIVGTGILNGQKAFNGDSAGFASSNLITSSAVLGTFTKGDSLVVQFVGAWDECSGQLRPSWLIKNVQLAFGKAAKASTFETAATASRQGKVIPFTYQWQRDDGTGFVNITGANAATFRIFPVATDFAARFRAVLTVPGKTVITSVVKLTDTTVEAPPTIAIAKSGATAVVTYTGTLQSAPTVAGPYQNVSNAQSPYTVPPPVGGVFFRSVK